jgi:RNA polymerase sigma-70 factor (ECF subfamily)
VTSGVPYINSDKLMDDFRACKKIAFEAVYKEFFSVIYAFCFKLVQDKEEAKDIATETFIKLFRLYDRFETLGNMRAFLYTTSRNACMDYFRTEKKRAQTNLYLVKEQSIDESTRVNDELDNLYYKALKNHINNLPRRQKQAIEMLFWEKMDYREAASQMDISVKSLYRIRTRAISVLRNSLLSQKLQESAVFIFFLFYSTCF